MQMGVSYRPNSTTVPTGSEAEAPTQANAPNSTKAPTGSGEAETSPPTVSAARSARSCEPFRQQILELLDQGLHAKPHPPRR
jgi:hypothetical protein